MLTRDERERRMAALSSYNQPASIPDEIETSPEVLEVHDIVAPSQPRRWEPDYPVITITISGPEGCGKSVISHLIRAELARNGINFGGPEGLRSINWRNAIRDLIDRGISVVIVKGE